MQKIISGALVLLLGGYYILDQVGIINDPLGVFQETNKQEYNSNKDTNDSKTNVITDYSNTAITYSCVDIPEFDGENCAYVLNDDTPFFTSEDLAMTYDTVVFSDLDEYGRAGVANGMLSINTMQTHDRGSISNIHPSGWWEAKNSDVNVNRSHLIGNNLAGDQTDVAENMITGSRQLNAGGAFKGSMLDYENEIADYMEETGNHVRYRVSPVFENVDVTPHGVLMEAESIEDGGAGIKLCVYIYNVQDGYTCDYTSGIWEKVTAAELTEDAK